MTMMTEALWQPLPQQQAFRLIMQAMAYPGRVQQLAGDDAARLVLATLLDPGVSLCDRHGLLAAADWPLLEATPADAAQADYLLVDGSRPVDVAPKLGTLPAPEQSATLLLRVAALDEGDTQLRLTGPGIATEQPLRIAGLHPDWLARRADWVAAFPLGVDLLLCDASRIAALPRTTRVEIC